MEYVHRNTLIYRVLLLLINNLSNMFLHSI